MVDRITEIHVGEEGLRHAIVFGDIFSVYDTDADIVYLEASAKEVEEKLSASHNPSMEILEEHREVDG